MQNLANLFILLNGRLAIFPPFSSTYYLLIRIIRMRTRKTLCIRILVIMISSVQWSTLSFGGS